MKVRGSPAKRTKGGRERVRCTQKNVSWAWRGSGGQTDTAGTAALPKFLRKERERCSRVFGTTFLFEDWSSWVLLTECMNGRYWMHEVEGARYRKGGILWKPVSEFLLRGRLFRFSRMETKLSRFVFNLGLRRRIGSI